MNKFHRAMSVAVLLGGFASVVSPPGMAAEGVPWVVGELRTRLSPEGEVIYHILVAEIAGRRGEAAVALEHYRAAVQASDDPRLVERAFSIALYLEDDALALAMARRWRALDADNLEARQAVAIALLRNGLTDEAIEQLEGLRSAVPDDGQEGFGMLGALFERVKDKAVVVQVMATLQARHPQSQYASYLYALTALEVKDYDQALRGLAAALALNPQWLQAHLLQARVMIAQGRTDAALASIAALVAQRPDDQALRAGFARLLVSADRLADARREYQELARRHPEDPEPLYALGLLAEEAKAYDQAVEHFMAVLKSGQRVLEVYFELGKVEEARGDYAKAREWYERVHAGDRYLDAQTRVGAMLARQGDLAGMAAHFDKLRQDNPDNAVILFLAQGNVLRQEKRYQEAFDLLTEALQQYPNDHELLYARALIAERVDRLDLLEQDLKFLIEADPDHGHALNALGYTLADRTDRYQEAYEYLQRAIILLPEDAAVLDSMGWIYYRLGQYEQSLDYLRRAYEREADAEIAAHLSELLWVTGRREEALETWRRALAKDPDSEHLRRFKERFGL